MKSLKITLILLLINLSLFAQSGMVFQGIARDNTSAAITDKLLGFTFRITLTDGTDLYKETQEIRTDNFGVFSHVIGTGSAVTGTFAGINFGLGNLKSIISVKDGNVDTQIYDQKFEYVPYAKHADNGVPVGSVIAFMGNEDKIPDGWLKVAGQDITAPVYAQLRAVLGGDANLPNAQGEYLKGAGTHVDPANVQGIAVRARQIQNTGKHYHNFDKVLQTNDDGHHRHTIKHDQGGTVISSDSGGYQTEFGSQNDFNNSAYYNDQGTDIHTSLTEKWVSTRYSHHVHTIRVLGDTSDKVRSPANDVNAGGNSGNTVIENRPDSIGVYWIIRYK